MDRLSKDGKYNVAGLATVAIAVLLTQVIAGGPWLEVGLILGGFVVLGAALGVIVARETHRRDPMRAIERAYAKPSAKPQRALPAGATGEAS